MNKLLYTLLLLAATSAAQAAEPDSSTRDNSYDRLMLFNDTTSMNGDAERDFEENHWNHPIWNPDGTLWPSVFQDSPWEFSRRDWV